ncbi:MAG: hypothetical protein AAGI36_10630 [Pseudomonadota bacterium]
MDPKSFELSIQIDRRKRARSKLYWTMPFGTIVVMMTGYWLEPVMSLVGLAAGVVASSLSIWSSSAWIAELQAEKDEWDQHINADDRA